MLLVGGVRRAAVASPAAHSNLVTMRSSIRMSPEMKARISNRVWAVGDFLAAQLMVLAVTDSWDGSPNRRESVAAASLAAFANNIILCQKRSFDQASK